MSGSDTQRTSEKSLSRNVVGSVIYYRKSSTVPTEFAEELERELNAANNRITELEQELRAAYERT